MANEWRSLTPQALAIENALLSNVCARRGDLTQIDYALKYLTRPNIPVESAVNVANGIIQSEKGSANINFIHIGKAYVSARVNLTVAEAQGKDVSEFKSKLVSPYDRPNSNVTAFFISHYGLPLVSQMNALYRNEGMMNLTDPLIALTQGISGEGYKYSKHNLQTMNQRRQEGMTLVELNLQEGRLQDAMTVSNDYFVTRDKDDCLNKAHTIASVVRASTPEELPKYLINAFDLVGEASRIIPNGSKTTMGDTVRFILANALAEKAPNVAETLILGMKALENGTFATDLIASAFGNKEAYTRLVVGALSHHRILLLELLGEFDQSNLGTQARNHIISILVDDLEMMLKNNILPFNQGMSKIVINNKKLISKEVVIYIDRLIEAAIIGVKRGRVQSCGPLSKLLASNEIHDLFGSGEKYLKDRVFLNWLSLISTGEPLEQSGH